MAARLAIPAVSLAQMRRAPTHPGEIFRFDVREALEEPMSRAETARRLDWHVSRMRAFEKGESALTAADAVALGALTGTSPEFWMRLQVHFDLWHAMQKAGKGTKPQAPKTR